MPVCPNVVLFIRIPRPLPHTFFVARSGMTNEIGIGCSSFGIPRCLREAFDSRVDVIFNWYNQIAFSALSVLRLD
jgi:hypothetical protein